MQPRQSLISEEVARRLEPRRVVERADMEVGLGRQLRAFAGERGAAGLAESPCRTGGRFELGDLPLCHCVGVAREADEDRDRRPTVPPTTLAMTPEHAFGLACRDKADGAAKTAACEFLVHLIKITAKEGAPATGSAGGFRLACP